MFAEPPPSHAPRPRSRSRAREALRGVASTAARSAQEVLKNVTTEEAFEFLADEQQQAENSWGSYHPGWATDEWSGWWPTSGSERWKSADWPRSGGKWWESAESDSGADEAAAPEEVPGLTAVQGPTFYKDKEGHVYNKAFRQVNEYGEVKHSRGSRGGRRTDPKHKASYTCDHRPWVFDPAFGKRVRPPERRTGDIRLA